MFSGFTDVAVEKEQNPRMHYRKPLEQLCIILCYVVGALCFCVLGGFVPWFGAICCILWAGYYYFAFEKVEKHVLQNN